jgi:hypothetical protein
MVKPLPSSVEASTVLVVGLLVTFPWCFDFHCPAEELTVARLQNRIDRVLDDHRIGSFRLRRVPGVLGCIKRRNSFRFVDEPFGLGVAGLGSEYRYFDAVDASIGQRFPGLMAYRA